jgi:hypothetical protein
MMMFSNVGTSLKTVNTLPKLFNSNALYSQALKHLSYSYASLKYECCEFRHRVHKTRTQTIELNLEIKLALIKVIIMMVLTSL